MCEDVCSVVRDSLREEVEYEVLAVVRVSCEVAEVDCEETDSESMACISGQEKLRVMMLE